MTRVGFWTCSMVQATVALLPDPVMPSSVWYRSPLTMPSLSAATAPGWSPAGANSDTILKGTFFKVIADRLYRRGVTPPPATTVLRTDLQHQLVAVLVGGRRAVGVPPAAGLDQAEAPLPRSVGQVVGFEQLEVHGLRRAVGVGDGPCEATVGDGVGDRPARLGAGGGRRAGVRSHEAGVVQVEQQPAARA